MDLLLKKKKVFIVGAGTYSKKHANIKGIGTVIAETFAKEKIKQISFSFNKSVKDAGRLVRSIKHINPKIRVENFQIDLSDINAFEKIKLEVAKNDILIYNAGVRFYKKHLTSREKKQTNLINFKLPKQLIDHFVKNNTGVAKPECFVYISSFLADHKHSHLKEYSASKKKMDEYIQKKSVEAATAGLRLVSIKPGFTKTPMTEARLAHYDALANRGGIPMRRVAEPSEIADVVAFISSPRSSYITGIAILVDGGVSKIYKEK